MTGTRPAEILRQLEQTGAADAELLARFVATKDAAAFAELVRRHGALVLGVCRRVTGHPHDAEDAFQATFLILAQKAGSLRNPALLGNWLYGVAFRVAWKARRSAARRGRREVLVSTLPDHAAPATSHAMPELTPILDEELAALPECYREAIVLCDLRGAAREEAAVALGIPEGTLSSRLANGRKKLAARLTKRGVSLSVAALPLAMSEAQAATTVPNELITKTCGLVADFAAGGAVPAPLARLTEGGFAVRKTLIFGAVMAVAVAGAVFAAQPRDDEPPNDPPKLPPAKVEKPEPQPKADEKAGPKPGRVGGEPKRRSACDISVAGWLNFQWNATGTHFALAGPRNGDRKDVKELWLLTPDRDSPLVRALLEADEGLAFVAPDGSGAATDVRQHQLISGHHELRFRAVKHIDPKAINDLAVARRVALDLPDTRGYAFAADGKSYRTVVIHHGPTGDSKIEVIEVDANSGKAGKSLLKVDAAAHALSTNGKRFAVFNVDAWNVTVYDTDRGAKVAEHTFPADKPDPLKKGGEHVVFSPNGSHLIATYGLARSRVLDTGTGKWQPELEGAATIYVHADTHAFTGDGGLLAAVCTPYTRVTSKSPAGKEQSVLKPGGTVLTVWDTQTGKALKTWQRGDGVRVAFNPARPLLAVMEANGDTKTRVGFWDFAAEVEKK